MKSRGELGTTIGFNEARQQLIDCSGGVELILRRGYVRIESLPDDFRCAPLDYNLRQMLIIPDCAKEPSRLAKVIALGPEAVEDGVRRPFEVKVGQIVLCNRYPKSFQGLEWNGEKVALMLETEILATVEVSNA